MAILFNKIWSENFQFSPTFLEPCLIKLRYRLKVFQVLLTKMPRSFLPYSQLSYFPHLHVLPFTQCIYITFFCLLTASTISKLGVVSLLLDSKATITHEALTMMLQIPLVATDTGSSLPGGAEHLRYAVRMGPSEHDISAAIQGIISYHNWTNLLVMYDGEFTKEEFFFRRFFFFFLQQYKILGTYSPTPPPNDLLPHENC